MVNGTAHTLKSITDTGELWFYLTALTKLWGNLDFPRQYFVFSVSQRSSAVRRVRERHSWKILSELWVKCINIGIIKRPSV